MKLQVVFNTDGRGPSLFRLDADAYHIDPRLGTLTITRRSETLNVQEPIVVYAAGSWRSIADVGALSAAIAAADVVPKATSETPRRREEERQV
jgi:hypothetical protein